MKHWVCLEWDEKNQRLTFNGSHGAGLTKPSRPTRIIVERGEDEPDEMFATRIGHIAILVAKGPENVS